MTWLQRDSVSFVEMERPSGHEIGGLLHLSERCVGQELTLFHLFPELLVLNLNFCAKLEK